MKKRKMTAVIHCSSSAAREGRCEFGCTGCGACADACKKEAVVLPEGRPAYIDREKCVGCGRCAKVCKRQIITLEPAENTILVRCSVRAPAKEAREQCRNSCIRCGICEKNCPAGAVRVRDGAAVIDGEKCLSCGMCAVKCPQGAIYDVNGIFTAK